VESQRGRTLFAFDRLAQIAESREPAPRFVMAHLMLPSPPFVFDRHGDRARPYGPGALGEDTVFMGAESQFIAAYTDQLHYLNDRILRLVKTLQERSSRPPVILIASAQGLDGRIGFPGIPPHDSRAQLAGAVMAHIPADLPGADVPYDTISLVNLFRIVLNRVCRADLPLLPDLAYDLSLQPPLQFQRVQP